MLGDSFLSIYSIEFFALILWYL